MYEQLQLELNDSTLPPSYYKTDSELIDELLQNVKTLHEENARLYSEIGRLEKYADNLVEHSNMPCLPADLRNLRTANLDFAMENQKLKTRIKHLESAIVKTLNKNRHLADGNDCTLIDIKNIVDWE